MIKIASSQHQIDVNLPIQMSGYAPMREANNQHDPLYAHVVLIEKDTTLYIWVSLDIVAIDHVFIETLKEKLKEIYPQYTYEIIASVTHTHSSLAGTLDTNIPIIKSIDYIFGTLDLNVIGTLVEASLIAVTQAIETLAEGEIGSRFIPNYNIGTDRNDVKDYYENQLLILELKNNNTKALLLFGACHPTVLSLDNTEITSDFLQSVYEAYPEYDSVMWLQGSAGNISTRYTRQASSFQEATRLGNEIVTTINKHPIQTYKPISHINLKHYTIKLKTKDYETLTIPYAIFSINEFRFICLPVEVTSKLTKDIVSDTTIIVSMTNGYFFYITERDNFNKNHYESQSSFLLEGEAENWMKIIQEQLKPIISEI